jgi:hypothetical protein
MLRFDSHGARMLADLRPGCKQSPAELTSTIERPVSEESQTPVQPAPRR